ncbi:MAG: 6-bladed beta-propeller [Balneolaceae bacterium]|nr:6-bladed beta-propeller [Balneolaceae bacterium]
MYETLTIGEEMSDTPEYMFGNNIRHVQPLKGGNIMIADASDNTIRIFNGDGQFLHKFGRRGRGPGEFSEISSVEITQDNRIIVIDRYQNRVTIFSQEGELLNTAILNTTNLTTTQFIFERRGHNSFFIGYRDFLRENDEGHYLHLFEAGFENEISRHLSVFDHFFDSSLSHEVRLSQPPNYFASRFGSHQIGVAPSIYTGTIAVLNEETKNEKHLGSPLPQFYELYDFDRSQEYFDSDEVGFSTTSWMNERYFFKRKGANFGLIGNQFLLLNFYVRFEGSEIIPFMHVYSASGELLQTVSLEEAPYPFIKNEKVLSIKPMYFDQENKLYIVDNYYEDTYPAVRVFKTNLHELLDHE